MAGLVMIAEELRTRARGVIAYRCSLELQGDRAIAHLDLAAARFRQQFRQAGRDEIDHVLLRRFVRGKRRRAAHGLLRPLRVSPPQLRERADVGDRIVQHLLRLGITLLGGMRRRACTAG